MSAMPPVHETEKQAGLLHTWPWNKLRLGEHLVRHKARVVVAPQPVHKAGER